MKHQCTANDTINLRIVGGLLCIGAMIIMGCIALLVMGKPIPETMMVMAGNIFAGLIGYLSRTADPGTRGPAVSGGSIETVNVEAAGTEGPGEGEKPAGTPVGKPEGHSSEGR